MKILGISGSLRRDSYNTGLLRAAAELLPEGVELELWERLKYNASIPGVLKNALDWVSRPVATNPLRNKPAAVVGASTGAFGAVWAQAEIRKVLSTIGARTLPNEVSCRQAA